MFLCSLGIFQYLFILWELQALVSSFSQTKRYAKDVELKRDYYEHYNILPIYAAGVKPAIMELPEVIRKFALISVSFAGVLLLRD